MNKPRRSQTSTDPHRMFSHFSRKKRESWKHHGAMPFPKPNFLSKIFFFWVWKIIFKGLCHELTDKDVYNCPSKDHSDALGHKLITNWLSHLKSCKEKDKTPRLWLVLVKTFGGKFLCLGLITLFEECVLRISQALALGYFIEKFDHKKTSKWEWNTSKYALILLGSTAAFSVTFHISTFAVHHVATRIRLACTSLFYWKCLRLNYASARTISFGRIVNLISQDMFRFDRQEIFLNALWVAPIQLILIASYLYSQYSHYTLVGITFMVLFLVLQYFLGRCFATYKEKSLNQADKRIKAVGELFASIGLIKMFAWESVFLEAVTRYRAMELKYTRVSILLRILNMTVSVVLAKVAYFVTLVCYIVFQENAHLDAKNVFTTLVLYEHIKFNFNVLFSNGVADIAEIRVAIRNIQKFLLMEEHEEPSLENSFKVNKLVSPAGSSSSDLGSSSSIYSVSSSVTRNLSQNAIPSALEIPDPLEDEIGVWVNNLTCRWSNTDTDMLPGGKYDANTLTDISFTVKSEQMVAIIGHVGSGKSSLLTGILGEMNNISGQVKVNGKIGYLGQDHWGLASQSLRDNITFGSKYDPVWYEQVISACALNEIFSSLPDADETLVRNVTLSGGQKVRLGLARAVYSKSDIYLLDDPLTGLDYALSRHVYESCLRGLLRKKAMVLVTHQLHLLQEADEILVLVEGRIIARGRYEELLKAGIRFSLSQADETDTERKGSIVSIEASLEEMHGVVSYTTAAATAGSDVTSRAATIVSDSGKSGAGKNLKPKTSDTMLAFARKFEEEQTVEDLKVPKKVGLKLYWKYLRSGGHCFKIFMLLLFSLVAQAVYTGSDYTLETLTSAEEYLTHIKDPNYGAGLSNNWSERFCPWTLQHKEVGKFSSQTRDVLRIIYMSAVPCLLLVYSLRTLILYTICMDANRLVYDKMMHGLVRSPVAFFNSISVGRLLNRISKDISIVDQTLPPTLFDAIDTVFQIFGIIAIVAYVNHLLFIPSVMMLLLVILHYNVYHRSAVVLKRMEAMRRTPIFTQIVATLSGLVTIRCSHQEDRFSHTFHQMVDEHTAVWYLFLSCHRWFAMMIDWISTAFIIVITIVLMESGQCLESPVVGLALATSIQLSSLFQLGATEISETETQMIAVERILEFADLQSEGELESPSSKRPPDSWPDTGEIRYIDLTVYVGRRKVLNSINLHIQGGEKVGIVGRSGSGKSTLVSALFRIDEFKKGGILIDSLDISCIGLHELRRKISIVPQNTVIYSGTLRQNCDPGGHHSDDEILTALREVQLDSLIQNLPQGLDSRLDTSHGLVLSYGQKQLLGIARALIEQNKIVICDEATANVNPSTEELIREIMAKHFSESTVLMIAHRLSTVIECDKIAVMESTGTISEYGSPYLLLKNEGSKFYGMVNKMGASASEDLMRRAKSAYVKKRRTLQSLST